MKKILVPAAAVLIVNVASAQTEYYVSAKLGGGDTIIYAHGDTKVGDELVDAFDQEYGVPHKYSNSGLLWEASGAVGLDWSPSNMYVKKNPYDWFHLRLEAEFGYNNYREDGKLKQNNIVQHDVEIKYDHFFMLANGYADFKIDSVVPYVGLGIGYSFGKEELTIRNLAEYNESIDDDGILYALHAGVGYKYSDITIVDLGYKRVYAPKEGDGLDVFSTIRLGVRFRI